MEPACRLRKTLSVLFILFPTDLAKRKFAIEDAKAMKRNRGANRQFYLSDNGYNINIHDYIYIY